MSDSPESVLRRLTTGVHVVGVAHGGRANAFTAAWIMQVSFEPLLVALSVNPEHASYPLLRDGRTFAVSVLRAEQLDLARHFGCQSGRDVDKLASVRTRAARSGAPILADAAAWLECRVTGQMRAGDHELVVAEVMDGGVLDPAAVPLAYRDTGDLDGSSALFPASFPGSRSGGERSDSLRPGDRP